MKEMPIPELRRLLRYEPETGKLFWRKRPASGFLAGGSGGAKGAAARWNALNAGNEAFCTDDGCGYMIGTILGRIFRKHRVIFAMEHGFWPSDQIDHRDGDRANNRAGNIRDATPTKNQRNRKMSSNNTSGVTGVIWDKPTSKWRAQIKLSGRQTHLGYFDNIEDAAASRKVAEREHGFTERHGRAVCQ